MISNIANSKYSARICAEKCQEFGEWYNEYRREHKDDLSGKIFVTAVDQTEWEWGGGGGGVDDVPVSL